MTETERSTLGHALTFRTPRMSSINVAVCKKVLLLDVSVKRNMMKSSRDARLLVIPSVCSGEEEKKAFWDEHQNQRVRSSQSRCLIGKSPAKFQGALKEFLIFNLVLSN